MLKKFFIKKDAVVYLYRGEPIVGANFDVMNAEHDLTYTEEDFISIDAWSFYNFRLPSNSKGYTSISIAKECVNAYYESGP